MLQNWRNDWLRRGVTPRSKQLFAAACLPAPCDPFPSTSDRRVTLISIDYAKLPTANGEWIRTFRGTIVPCAEIAWIVEAFLPRVAKLCFGNRVRDRNISVTQD